MDAILEIYIYIYIYTYTYFSYVSISYFLGFNQEEHLYMFKRKCALLYIIRALKTLGIIKMFVTRGMAI